MGTEEDMVADLGQQVPLSVILHGKALRLMLAHAARQKHHIHPQAYL